MLERQPAAAVGRGLSEGLEEMLRSTPTPVACFPQLSDGMHLASWLGFLKDGEGRKEKRIKKQRMDTKNMFFFWGGVFFKTTVVIIIFVLWGYCGMSQ